MNQFSNFDHRFPFSEVPAPRAEATAELFALIEELSRKARLVQDRTGRQSYPVNAELEAAEQVAAKLRRMLRDRERRKKMFPTDLFADPAWDILLNLYASQLEQRRETITGVIFLAGVPPTTGLRWVHKLVEQNLLILRDDPLDARRKYVLLSPNALAALDSYFNLEPRTGARRLKA